MSKAKWCKGEELTIYRATTEALTKPIIYMNGRAISTKLISRWFVSNFYGKKWHRAIPLVHEKELINRVLTYTKVKPCRENT